MREYRDADYDDFGYGRPSLSAWIAVLAVALAVFVGGGFVKTYRQLQEVREETRREIQQLRETVGRLQGQEMPAAAASRASASLTASRPEPLPRPLQPERTERTERADGALRRTGTESVRPENPDFESAAAGDGEDRPRISFGRRSGVSGAPRGTGLQVIAAAPAQKRVMVEGGRRSGLTAGARLELTRGGAWIGDLRVTEVYDDKAACEILHANQTPEAGDGVRWAAPQAAGGAGGS